MTGCVGALGGYALKINRPNLDEVGDPNQFFNRKGFYAIALQAVCDRKRRLLFGSAFASTTKMAFVAGLAHGVTNRSALRLRAGL